MRETGWEDQLGDLHRKSTLACFLHSYTVPHLSSLWHPGHQKWGCLSPTLSSYLSLAEYSTFNPILTLYLKSMACPKLSLAVRQFSDLCVDTIFFPQQYKDDLNSWKGCNLLDTLGRTPKYFDHFVAGCSASVDLVHLMYVELFHLHQTCHFK